MHIIKQVGVFSLAFVLTFLLLEGYMQLAEVEPVSVTDYDPRVGRITIPNRTFTYYNENFTIGHYNQYGYLGPAYPKHRSGNELRIALIGDSYVEGFQVQERNHFRHLMEQKLQEHIKDRDIQVLNFGRSGFDLANSYAYYLNFVADFDPDITLYFLAASDLMQSKDDPLLPSWYLDDGQLRMSNDFQESSYLKTFQWASHGLHHSSILQMLNDNLKLVQIGEAPHIILGKAAAWLYPEQANKSNTPQPEVDEVSLAIIQELGRHSGSVIINRDSISFPPEAQHTIRQADIPLIYVADTLEPLHQQGMDAIAWKVTNTRGHWNHLGHQAVATYLSQKLIPIIQTHHRRALAQP